MGIDCYIKDLENVWSLNSHYPVFSTLKKDTIIDKFKDFKYISLGEILASALINHEKVDRKNYVISELEKIFNIKSKNLIIDNIDILFNPEYNLDILGFFVQIGRNRRLIVLWPGEYAVESLIYALPGCEDYKKYSIRDYNVIVLK